MLCKRIAISMLITSILSGSAQGWSGKQCDVESIDAIPLNDLGPGDYAGFRGGLYPGGVNMRPFQHTQAGIEIAESLHPLNSAGEVDHEQGVRVVLIVGMSNAQNIGTQLIALAQEDALRHSQVVLINGAQAGKGSAEIADPSDSYWQQLQTTLNFKGVTREQVQVVWSLQAMKYPTAPFPEHAEEFQSQLRDVSNNLQSFFPNLKMLYWSSRIYGAYSSFELHPEPYAYESAFGVKWLIESQLDGAASLNFDHEQGEVLAPWMSWAAYFWADGIVPRSDGLTWECDEFIHDGIHPTQAGAAKAAHQVLEFLQTDPTARRWYLQDPPSNCLQPPTIEHFGAELYDDSNAYIASSRLPSVLSMEPLILMAAGAPPNSPGFFLIGTALNGYGSHSCCQWLHIDPVGLTVVPTATDELGQAHLFLASDVGAGAYCQNTFHAQFVAIGSDGIMSTYALSFKIGD